MNGIITLGVLQIALSYIFVLIVLAIISKRGIRREKEIVIASFRMTIQLVLVGYILAYLFNNPNPVITTAIISLMECFAIYTIIKTFKGKLSKKLKIAIAFSMVAGTVSCIFYFLLIVVRIDPWYDPRYFIPIAGMLVGNSMTAVSLGVNSLIEGMTIQKSQVEEAMILGRHT